MTKQEIIQTLHNIRTEHSVWATQEKILIEGINLDQLVEPTNYFHSEMYTWLNDNKQSLFAFSWYKAIKSIHSKLHGNYSDLFYASMRKYNPKKREELEEDFKEFEVNLLNFNNKIFQIEEQVEGMSDEEFLDTVVKSNAESRKADSEKTNISETSDEVVENIKESNHNEETNETDSVELEHEKDTQEFVEANEENTDSKIINANDINEDHKEQFEKIVIEDFDHNEVQNLELANEEVVVDKVDLVVDADSIAEESVVENVTGNVTENVAKNVTKNVTKNTVDNVKENTEDTLQNNKQMDKKPIDSMSQAGNFAFKGITNVTKSADDLNKHISLKEMNIAHLNEDKELVEKELNHLEETETLSKRGVDQLEKQISLKKQEFELEQQDNQKLFELNSEARDKTNERLTGIEENRNTLKNTILDLEQQNIEDKLNVENDRKTTTIEKQFETLKHNKTKDLNVMEEHLYSRKNELVKLKQQVELLEEEIAEMEEDVSNKQKSIADLEEKERQKNEERNKHIGSQEEIIQQREIDITNKQKELDELTEQRTATKDELTQYNQHLEEMKKSLNSAVKNSDVEIANLEQQQLQKKERLTETEELKAQKQKEIDLIESKIQAFEDQLSDLKADVSNDEKDLETSY